jgi:hypothetical protein
MSDTALALAPERGQAEGDASAPAGAAVTGYVEARTRDRILGWAWDPSLPAVRLAVALVAGDRVVARTIADQHRDDLARNGIGDGRHAFAFLLDEPLRDHVATLEVAVIAADGGLVRLGSAVADAPPPAIHQVQRGLAALAAGQRALLKAVQAPAHDRGAELAEALSAIAAQQQRIEQAVGALEIFVTRLDGRLAALAATGAQQKAPRGILMVAAALALGGAAALAWAIAPALG